MDKYIDDLLIKKGIPVTEKSRDALANDIQDFISTHMVESLPLAELDKLEAAGDNVDEDLIEQLLNEAGLDASKIINEALDTFRNEYLKGDKK